MTSDNIKKEPDTIEDTPQVRFGSSVKFFSGFFYKMFQGKATLSCGCFELHSYGRGASLVAQPQISVFVPLRIFYYYKF